MSRSTRSLNSSTSRRSSFTCPPLIASTQLPPVKTGVEAFQPSTSNLAQLAGSNVYILTADGSSLFLLNPSQPSAHEHPPPYAPYKSSQEAGLTRAFGETLDEGLGRADNGLTADTRNQGEMATLSPSGSNGNGNDRDGRARSSSTRLRASSDATNSLSAGAAAVFEGAGGKGQGGYFGTVNGHGRGHGTHPRVHTSSLGSTDSVPFPNSGSRSTVTRGPPGLHRIMSDAGPPSASRHTFDSSPADERTPLLSSPDNNSTPNRQRAQSLRSNGARTSRSISISTQDGAEVLIPFPWQDSDKAMPSPVRRSNWRNMLRAPSHAEIPTVRLVNTPGGEALVVTRPKRKAHWFVRYTRCSISGAHWGALFHLVFLNAPFAVLLWPILVAGTLSGTALLITLPIGAIVWFLVLIISRTACRLELAMQIYFHSPLRSSIPRPVYFNIFRRLKVVEGPGGAVRPIVEVQGRGTEMEVSAVLWEKNFLKNAWSMFSDHISYQCLSYLILTKALITLLSSIVIIVVVPVSFALIIPFPGALELVRRFGRWQAGVAVEALQ